MLARTGERVWSGSFVVEGAALLEATAVGPGEPRGAADGDRATFRHPRSPLERANDRLLLLLVVIAVPLTVALSVLGLSPRGLRSARCRP